MTAGAALRAAALALLPGAVHASPLAGAALAAALALLTRERRAARLTLPVVGFLAAGGLSVLVDPSTTALSAWAYWLLGAGVLFALYVSTRPEDAGPLALGAAAANVLAAGLALYQVAEGSRQATLLSFHPNMAAAWTIAALGANLLGFRSLGPRPLAWRALVALGVPAGLLTLALTGSRSGVVGAATGAVLLGLFALRRARPRALVLAAVGAAVLALGLWQVDAYLRGAPSPNLFTNSGFEDGTLPWSLGSGSRRVELPGGGVAVRLERDEPGALLRYVGGVPVEEGQELALGLAALPEAAPGGAAPLAVSVAVDAYAADGTLVARLGVDGWTEDPGAALSTVGDRPALPSAPVGEWQRVVLPLPPLPTGAARLSLELQIRGGAGAYGLVDDLMLASTSTTAYVPGRRPGLFTPLAPTLARLELLRRPLETSGGRVGMWYLGLDLASARPVLGHGLGSSHALADEHAARRVRQPLEHFHSLYVQLLVEGGSVLFAAFLVLTGGLLASAWRGAVRRRAGALTLLATTVALLTQSVFDPVLSFVPVLGCWWLVFCVAEEA